MTGESVGPEPELLGAQLVPEFQQAIANGLSLNEVREFLYRRLERFKPLTELREAIALVRKVGAESLASKTESVINGMTARLK